jgi:hypothetical protein
MHKKFITDREQYKRTISFDLQLDLHFDLEVVHSTTCFAIHTRALRNSCSGHVRLGSPMIVNLKGISGQYSGC